MLLIYGSAYLLKRYGQTGTSLLGKKGQLPRREADTIQVLHQQRLSAQAQLQLIRINDTQFLLAVTPDGVQLLKEFPALSPQELSHETNP